MKKTLLNILGATCLAAFLAARAHAVPILPGTAAVFDADTFPGLKIVGIAEVFSNDTFSNGNFKIVGQHILDLAANVNQTNFADGTANNQNVAYLRDYSTSDENYDGTYVGLGDHVDQATIIGNNFKVGAGWEYVLAKYDGTNAGFILFYLGGADATIPQFPYPFWTDNRTQYGITSWVTFNRVPDGGSTVLMLGGAIVAIAFFAGRRRRRLTN